MLAAMLEPRPTVGLSQQELRNIQTQIDEKNTYQDHTRKVQ